MRLATAPSGTGADSVVELDAAHWARQGSLSFDLRLTDGVVVSSDVVPGFMHRGAEKLFEARDYRQGMALANRHDWLAPVGGEILMARAAEDLLGMSVPPRAAHLRLLVLELSRAAAMLAFLGPAAEPTSMPDARALRLEAARRREELLGLLEALTGARMHVTYVVVGGVHHDATPEWLAQASTLVEAIQRDTAPLFESAVAAAEFLARCAGLGVITTDSALGHGASGVVGRASGVARDLRRDEPVDAGSLHLLPLPAEGQAGGDAVARLLLMAAELRAALRLAGDFAAQAAAAEGAVSIALPKVLRVPVGSSLQWLETPLGAAGGLLEARGDRVPHRYALRTPSLAHAPLLAAAMVGHRLDDAAAILSSFPMVVGDVDK